MEYLLTLDMGADSEEVFTCVGDCNSKFEQRLAELIAPTIGTNVNSIHQGLWGWACLSVISEKDQKLAEKYMKKIGGPKHWRDGQTHYEFISATSLTGQKRQSAMWNRFNKQAYLVLAGNLEAAGRPLEAAAIYDHYGVYDKARSLREREKQVIIKQTNVSIDLNALLKQVKDGGIVVVYRCPHCGGKLKVGKETSLDFLKVCEHCGSEIAAMDLADFLRSALS
jgi:hypothetical protein